MNSALHRDLAGSGVTGIVMRGIAAAICLLPPTLLMGATLPAISRWVESTPEGVVVARVLLRRQHRRRRHRQPARRVSICCASTTCRSRPSSRWRSTSSVALLALVDREGRASRRGAADRRGRGDAGAGAGGVGRLRRDRAVGR